MKPVDCSTLYYPPRGVTKSGSVEGIFGTLKNSSAIANYATNSDYECVALNGFCKYKN